MKIQRLAFNHHTHFALCSPVALIIIVAGTLATSQRRKQPQPKALAKPNAILKIEAGLVFRSGDVKPVARTTFYLLDADPAQVLKEGGVKRESEIEREELDPMFDLALALRFQTLEKNQTYLTAAMVALKPHIIGTAVTGFDGKAEFSPIITGTYNLMGVVPEIGKSSAFWNLKITLKAGPQTIVLDNHNTGMIF
jgi:hypothetical protein